MVAVCGIITTGEPDLTYWPKARLRKPGFLLSPTGQETLLSRAYAALRPLCESNGIYVTCSEPYLTQIKDIVPDIADKNMIIEPANRGTFSSLGLGVCHLGKSHRNPVIVSFPPNLWIKDIDEFQSALEKAIEVAQSRQLFVTIGSKPTYPEPDYCYLKVQGKDLAGIGNTQVVTKIQYKPGRVSALKAIEDGQAFWSSGVLVFQEQVWWKHLGRYLSDSAKAFKAINLSIETNFYKRVLTQEYASLSSSDIWSSIFRSSVESKNKSMVMIDIGSCWEILNSWRALSRAGASDSNGNLSSGAVLNLGCAECIIDSQNALVVAIGLRNIAVIAADDVVMICDKDKEDDVRTALGMLRNNGMVRYL